MPPTASLSGVEDGGPGHAVPAPIGLYVHVPFCARKCPYCDFNTYAGMESYFQATVEALAIELQRWKDRLQARTITSIFVGGGTPTVLTNSQLTRLFTLLHENFVLSSTCEITCEANPGTVDRAKFQTLRSMGANRLSLGVQSFQTDELAFLGRIHDVMDVCRAFDAARAAGFDNINLDFIFGLPAQREDAWDNTLQRALELGPEHLSLYSLIVEPNTPLNYWVESGRVAAPDEDVAAVLYEMAMDRLSAHGYQQYEVSNWARQSESTASPHDLLPALASRHNLLYWRNQEYIGIGPGAHSHMRCQPSTDDKVARRWGNRKSVPGYVRRVLAEQSVEDFHEEIDAPTAMGETMMLGLRLLREGVPYARFLQQHGADLRRVYAVPLAQLEEMELLERTEERVRLTPRGLMLGNQIFSQFLPDAADEHRPETGAGANARQVDATEPAAVRTIS